MVEKKADKFLRNSEILSHIFSSHVESFKDIYHVNCFQKIFTFTIFGIVIYSLT